MIREHRYVVIKDKDIAAYLTEDEQQQLNLLCTKINVQRLKDSRRLLACVVVENDWPEYEPTWHAIEKRVDGK